MKRFHIITIFPDMCRSYTSESMLGKAAEKKLIEVSYYNPRDFTADKHKRVDDEPYGGGPGMVMQAEPILKAWAKARGRSKRRFVTIFFTPDAPVFTDDMARKWDADFDDIIFICGRYEGVDERVVEATGAIKVSMGDFVLTGGELPALMVVDAMARLVPKVLGNQLSDEAARAASNKVYTRPETLKWKKQSFTVPPVLLSGDHKKIEQWRKGN